MMADDDLDRYVSQGVELAMHVAQLPAIPTATWCRDAARTIAPIGDYQRALVAVARTSRDGMLIEEVISAGVHVPGGHAEHMEESLLRLRRVAWLPPQSAPDMNKSWATAIDADAMRRTQAAGWNLSVSPWIVVAAAPFGEACDGHVLIVAVGASDASAARSAMVPTVRALASLLAKRARVALGCPDQPIRWISPREQQVLELLIEGMSVKEIGESLGRSPHTITDHLKSLHRKLEANSRGELVSKALGRHSSRGGVARTLVDESSPQDRWQ
jgi:DNA-binding CsgD family transcriptional regulator